MLESHHRITRNSDGTGFEGHISYNWSSFRKNSLELKLYNTDRVSFSDIYLRFGTCDALEIRNSDAISFQDAGRVYRFLYGYTLEELMVKKDNDSNRPVPQWLIEPKTWIPQMVLKMDWEDFCFSFYAFLSSDTDFSSLLWETLGSIIFYLKNNPSSLQHLLMKSGKEYSEWAQGAFWDAIDKAIMIKERCLFKKDVCFTTYNTLKRAKPLLSEENYLKLERECYSFLETIARERIDDACGKKYTVQEIMDFDIERFFFYNELFSIPLAFEELKEYVRARVFSFFLGIGERVADAGDVLNAEAIYLRALEVSNTKDEKNMVLDKRRAIAVALNTERELQKKRILEVQAENKKKEQKEKVSDFITNASVILFISSIVFSVLFGLLSVLGLAKRFVKTGFFISLTVLIFFVLILTVNVIIEKVEDRKK